MSGNFGNLEFYISDFFKLVEFLYTVVKLLHIAINVTQENVVTQTEIPNSIM